MEYLGSKWKMWFKSLDTDHDGKLTRADMEISSKKFADIRAMLGDKAPDSGYSNENWWNTYIFRNGPGVELTEEQFVAALGQSYSKDKQAFISEMQNCFGDVANFVASDRERSIDSAEFTFGFKVFGQDDTEKVAKAFRMLTESEGSVNTQRIVDAWVQFITDDDQAKLDVVREAFGAK